MKFSGMKRSSMTKLVGKLRLLEDVATETVTHSLMTDISAGGQAIVLKFWKYVLPKQRYILCSEQNFLRLTDFLI